MTRKLLLFHALVLCLALAMVIGSVVVAHRLTGSGLALGIATFCLLETLYLVLLALRALVTDEKADPVGGISEGRRRQLEREKYYLLKAIKELEFDYEMGKVAKVDRDQIGGNYRARALRVLRLLDTTGSDEGYREMIFRELKLRGKSASAKEAAVRTAASTVAVVSDRRGCQACGASNETDAAFCKKCAQPLSATAKEI